MNYEVLWSNGLLVSVVLIVTGAVAIPIVRRRFPQYVAHISVRRNTQILIAGIGLFVLLVAISLIRAGSPFGMMPVPPEPKRTLSDSKAKGLKDAMLLIVPRNKSVTVFSMRGHGEGCSFAKEIHAFLKGNGFTMTDSEASCDGLALPVPYGIAYQDEANEFKVIVGLNRR